MLARINNFLRLLSIFLLFSFFISMVVVGFITSLNKESFCYEVMPADKGFVLNNITYYVNETSCVVIEYKEYSAIKNSYFWPQVFSFVGLLGWFIFSPDFRSRLKEKLKTFKQ